jgi:hypothetical protein
VGIRSGKHLGIARGRLTKVGAKAPTAFLSQQQLEMSNDMRNFFAGVVATVLVLSGLFLAVSYCPTEDSCGYGYKHHIGYSHGVTP